MGLNMRTNTRTRTRLQQILFPLAVLMLIGLTQRTAVADPLVFSNVTAFQNNNSTQVDLFSNPGSTLYGKTLNFSIDISGVISSVDTLLITYNEVGSLPIIQTFQIPLFGSVQPPFTLLFSVTSPGSNQQGVAASLTIDLLNSSPDFVIPGGARQGQTVDTQTYSFNVAQPVPEPMSLLSFIGGLAALGVRYRGRK